ncbi:MAG: hypothetical protein J7521_08225 [Caulobacter sp.]|nr:hypothetical protein [Caulobacter sp.]
MTFQLAPFLGMAATLLVCGLAFVRGSAAERWGAVIVIGGSIVSLLIQLLLPKSVQGVVSLLCEGVYGFCFLMLALRYASPWLGGAMLLQAIQFSLHAYYIVGEKAHDQTYRIVNNLNSVGVLICILFGIVATWRKRAQAGK